jgi:hypothetical protein
MTTIMPQGELMRKAVAWIGERRKETGESSAASVEKAAAQFNLSPKDVDFLKKFFSEKEEA